MRAVQCSWAHEDEEERALAKMGLDSWMESEGIPGTVVWMTELLGCSCLTGYQVVILGLFIAKVCI